MNREKQGVAFFDLDGTITTKDTFIDFIIFCRGKLIFSIGIIKLSPLIFMNLMKLYPNYKLKEKFFNFFLAIFTVSELQNFGKEYGNKRLPQITYQKAIEKINWHKRNQEKVIILTASSNIWLDEWCKNMKIELISTSFTVTNNRYTGKIEGKNCYGIQKKKIVEKIISSINIGETYGYGDSKADLHFINILKHKYYKPNWI